MHKYEVAVSDGRNDRILRNPIEAESARHAKSLGLLHCRTTESVIRVVKLTEPKPVKDYFWSDPRFTQGRTF